MKEGAKEKEGSRGRDMVANDSKIFCVLCLTSHLNGYVIYFVVGSGSIT